MDKKDPRCPYLRQVTMVYCEAYPVKKMVPLDRVQSTSHCLGEDFHLCALFNETTERLHPPPAKRPHARAAEQTKRKSNSPVDIP